MACLTVISLALIAASFILIPPFRNDHLYRIFGFYALVFGIFSLVLGLMIMNGRIPPCLLPAYHNL
jgi:hypothetical protein